MGDDIQKLVDLARGFLFYPGIGPQGRASITMLVHKRVGSTMSNARRMFLM